MILFKAELVEKIRTCRCRHDFIWHVGACQGNNGLPCPCTEFDGQKTQTRRLWKRARVRVGSTHNVNTSYYGTTGLRIEVLRVWEEDPKAISEADAVAEGFSGRDAFLAYFHSINDARNLDGRRPFAIEFRLLSIG